MASKKPVGKAKVKARAKNKSSTSKALSAADILDAPDTPFKRVNIPEWGGHVFVRSMSAAERDAFEIASEGRGVENIRARVAAATVVDKHGRALFTMDDADRLGEKDAGPFQRIFNVSAPLNGLSAQDVEEISGN